MEDNLRFVRIYAWVHGIGFTKPALSTFRKFRMILISISLAVFFNAWTLYDIFSTFYGTADNPLMETIANVSTIVQRITFYLRRRQIEDIVKRISVLYTSLTPDHKVNFKMKSAAILLIYDSIFIGIWIACFVNMNDFKGETTYGIIPLQHAEIFKFIKRILDGWGNATQAMSAYFCSMCYMLKVILTELQKKLKKADHNVDYLFGVYNEIMDAITEINDTFGALFVFGFISISAVAFMDFIVTLKFGLSNVVSILILTMMCHIFDTFVAICALSSSVTSTVSRLKNVIHGLPLALNWDTIICFKLKVNVGLTGFTILDSITLNKFSLLWAPL